MEKLVSRISMQLWLKTIIEKKFMTYHINNDLLFFINQIVYLKQEKMFYLDLKNP